MSDHVGEAWRRAWKTYLAANLPAALAGFSVRESTEEGDRPQQCVVIGFRGVERVPAMDSTGRVNGVIALREPFDDATLEQHKVRARALWEVIHAVTVKPGPLTGVYLHDLRISDRESGVQEDDRITGWPISCMTTTTVEV